MNLRGLQLTLFSFSMYLGIVLSTPVNTSTHLEDCGDVFLATCQSICLDVNCLTGICIGTSGILIFYAPLSAPQCSTLTRTFCPTQVVLPAFAQDVQGEVTFVWELGNEQAIVLNLIFILFFLYLLDNVRTGYWMGNTAGRVTTGGRWARRGSSDTEV
jgi:hypothetical protein